MAELGYPMGGQRYQWPWAAKDSHARARNFDCAVVLFAVGASEMAVDRGAADPKGRGDRGDRVLPGAVHLLGHPLLAVMAGAAVQRCRVHFLRNILAQVPKGSSEMVAAAIRTIFAQPDATHVHEQLDVIAGMLGRQFPKLERMLRDAAPDLLAFTSFPVSHWKKLWSTNPLERLTKEIKRRTDVVGVFPNPRPCCGWLGRCWSRPMTSGRSATAATSPKAPWPCSPRRPRR